MTELQAQTWADDGGRVLETSEPSQELWVTLGGLSSPVELVRYRSETGRALVRQLEPMLWWDALDNLVSKPAGALVDVAAHKLEIRAA